jgi:hypothetical protein
MIMSEDNEAKQYNQFRVDLLNSKFNGVHSEQQMIERLFELCRTKNRYALRGLEDAKLSCSPDSRMTNSIWITGAIYSMMNVASPSQTGPAGTDNFGLWRDDEEKK